MLLALLLVALAGAAIPATATDLTYSGQKIVISQPGTYVLKNDISNSNQLICIEIRASNVVFDGGGHLIDGTDAEGSAGIFVNGIDYTVTGVTIKNVRIQDWYYGVYLYGADNSKIQSATLQSNGFTGAVSYKNAVGNTITGCTITGNGYGLVFSDGATNGVVSDNKINQNDRGLYVYSSDGIAVTRNEFGNNINSGLQLHTSGGGTIHNNRLNNNLNVAFTGEPFKANAWSVTPPATNWNPANIIGGPKVGGNYWGRPDGTGYSQTNADANGDGFIDTPLQIAEQNFDNYPLAPWSGPTPTVTVTVPTTTITSGQQSPYRAVTLPGRLEAENYDLGGEGVAYHDLEAANQGKAYRPSEGVDVETKGTTTNVGYIRTGEWIEYTVNVASTGTYTATFRVAAWSSGRQIAVSVDGVPKATVSLPVTGSYTAWKTVSTQIPLEAGTHVIRLAFNNNQNLDYVDFTTTGSTVVPTTTPTGVVPTQQPGQSPYNGPHALPGTVQAEDFDNGGQNVAYWDSTTENKPLNTPGYVAYRPNEYVDAETINGISDIGWITDGEWLEYTVDVASAGTYTATFRVASWGDGRKITVTVDGAPGCTVNVPNTGSPSVYHEVPATLALSQGTHVIRLTFNNNSQNIDWFAVAGGPAPTATTPVPTATVTVNATETIPTTTVTETTTTQPQTGQAPYKTFIVPCRVEAEDYDSGGEGIAYHDTTPENQGMDYRLAESVDIDAGGVRHIGYVQSGEWVEYTVNVLATGTYPTSFRVGSWYPELGTRSITVSVDGSARGTVTVPITGSDRLYETVTVPLALNAGQQTIRLTFNGARQNLDYFEMNAGTVPTTTTMVPTSTTPVTTTPPSGGQSPYNGPHALPGTVQAEDFDNGGQNVAYWDSTTENKPLNTPGYVAYRPNEYVDAETINGISDIGWITSGEWLEYTVDVPTAGTYTATFRVASWGDGRKITVTVDGAPGCTVNVPNTGSPSVYQEVPATLALSQGTHVIRLTFNNNSQNIDWFAATPA
jgi:parallel beta-helix repeat protein